MGDPPFVTQSNNETYARIRSVDIKWPEHITEDAKDLIQKFLVKDPKKRISLTDVESHPWIVRNCADA